MAAQRTSRVYTSEDAAYARAFRLDDPHEMTAAACAANAERWLGLARSVRPDASDRELESLARLIRRARAREIRRGIPERDSLILRRIAAEAHAAEDTDEAR